MEPACEGQVYTREQHARALQQLQRVEARVDANSRALFGEHYEMRQFEDHTSQEAQDYLFRYRAAARDRASDTFCNFLPASPAHIRGACRAMQSDYNRGGQFPDRVLAYSGSALIIRSSVLSIVEANSWNLMQDANPELQGVGNEVAAIRTNAYQMSAGLMLTEDALMSASVDPQTNRAAREQIRRFVNSRQFRGLMSDVDRMIEQSEALHNHYSCLAYGHLPPDPRDPAPVAPQFPSLCAELETAEAQATARGQTGRASTGSPVPVSSFGVVGVVEEVSAAALAACRGRSLGPQRSAERSSTESAEQAPRPVQGAVEGMTIEVFDQEGRSTGSGTQGR